MSGRLGICSRRLSVNSTQPASEIEWRFLHRTPATAPRTRGASAVSVARVRMKESCGRRRTQRLVRGRFCKHKCEGGHRRTCAYGTSASA
eukprot:5745345-Pleurochrysis_carterae.AAC.1